MRQNDLALLGHLLRRIGFGATRDELERYSATGYEETVEELLHPERVHPPLEEEDLLRRFQVEYNGGTHLPQNRTYWLSRMINTKRPLEEKMALFWHGVFATSNSKLNQAKAVMDQLEMFRRYGLGSFHTLLVELSKSPAMIFWLDNNNNHGDAVNENFGRELFSMGVGNYTEDDVRQASRAFTCCRPCTTPSSRRSASIRCSLSGRVAGLALRVQGRRPRRRREDIHRPHWTLQRRGHNRHHMSATCDGQFPRPTSVQLLCGRRGPGACLEHRSTA